MSDINREFDTTVELVRAAEIELIQHIGEVNARKHELLSYKFLKFNSEKEYAWQALLRRFSRNPEQKGNVQGVEELTFALRAYLAALEAELEKPLEVQQKQSTAS